MEFIITQTPIIAPVIMMVMEVLHTLSLMVSLIAKMLSVLDSYLVDLNSKSSYKQIVLL